jgi:hypothetical protein
MSVRILILLLGNLLAIACATRVTAKELTKATKVAADGYPSLEALVEDAIAKLNAKDTATLTRMSFGREEFLQAYPFFETDTSQMRRNFACDYYLADNRKLLLRRLDQVGGKALTVTRIEVQGNRMEHKAFVLSQGLKIWVLEGERVHELSFLKSAVKTESGWKIWSFEDS